VKTSKSNLTENEAINQVEEEFRSQNSGVRIKTRRSNTR